MRVLLTAGGTREPIDDVRVIANTSTGRLGALLTEAFARAGHEVTLLHAAAACQPMLNAGSVRCHAFETSAELSELLSAHVPESQVVLHAAAVSDYLPEASTGKLASDAEQLVIKLRRAPKLIDTLRELAPHALLVGFKLTSGKSEAERERLCANLRQRADLNLVVSNEAASIGEHDHAVLIFDERGLVCRCAGKQAIAENLLKLVSDRAVSEAEKS